MSSWKDIENSIKAKIETVLKETEIYESNLQFEKIVADAIKERLIVENVIKRKQLPKKKLLYEDKEIPGKFILYRDDSKIKIGK